MPPLLPQWTPLRDEDPRSLPYLVANAVLMMQLFFPRAYILKRMVGVQIPFTWNDAIQKGA